MTLGATRLPSRTEFQPGVRGMLSESGDGTPVLLTPDGPSLLSDTTFPRTDSLLPARVMKDQC